MSEQIYLTAEGAERMRKELVELTGVGREELAARLRFAISQGDLSENADYHKAKEDQAFLEGRIMELEYLLKNAAIIAAFEGERETVDLGARVTVVEEDFPPDTYLMVGAPEADPRNGKISNVSPIGKALMGCRAGDTIQVQTPDGVISLTVVKIE